MLKGDGRGRGRGLIFFYKFIMKGPRGMGFGGKRRGKGVSFYRKTFFSLLNG
jgi:hypothetical protein